MSPQGFTSYFAQGSICYNDWIPGLHRPKDADGVLLAEPHAAVRRGLWADFSHVEKMSAGGELDRIRHSRSAPFPGKIPPGF